MEAFSGAMSFGALMQAFQRSGAADYVNSGWCMSAKTLGQCSFRPVC